MRFFPAPFRSPTPPVTWTFNSSYKGADITLDAAKTTASFTVGTQEIVIATAPGSTTGKSTGKWYWEIAVNGTTWNSRAIGIALSRGLNDTGSNNAMWNTTSNLYDFRSLLVATSTTAIPCKNIAGTNSTATTITLPSTLNSSSVFMVALDVNAGAIWFGLDGTWLKSASTAEIVAGITTNAVWADLNSSTSTEPWTPAVNEPSTASLLKRTITLSSACRRANTSANFGNLAMRVGIQCLVLGVALAME